MPDPIPEASVPETPFELPFYVIYDSSTDMPGSIVVRRCVATVGSADGDDEALGVVRFDADALFCAEKNNAEAPAKTVANAPVLQSARLAIRNAYAGAHCIGRMPEDEPHIVEVWL